MSKFSSFVCHLNYSYSCFLPIFASKLLLIPELFLVTVISFCSDSLYHLCIVISFLILWSIFWSYSLVHFKNSPEYLSWGTARVLIAVMRFLLCSLVSNTFVILLKLKNFFLLSFPLVWWYPLPIFPSTCKFPFIIVFWFFLDLAILFLPSFVFFFCFSLFAWHICLC